MRGLRRLDEKQDAHHVARRSPIMSRLVFATVLACIASSIAAAKELCIQLDTGGSSGSRIVLKKVKLGRGNVAPAQGYFARYDPGTLTYGEFSPIDGGSIVNSNGDIVLGLAWHEVAIRANNYNVLNDNIAVNVGCTAGPDGKLGVLDPCSAYVSNQAASAHVILCEDVAPIP
jgi:hypothetical protein